MTYVYTVILTIRTNRDMNKEDVKKGYLAAMATMGIDANDAREYWESYESSQLWKVNHSDIQDVSIDDVRCKVCTKTLADSELFEKTCIHCGSEC